MDKCDAAFIAELDYRDAVQELFEVLTNAPADQDGVLWDDWTACILIALDVADRCRVIKDARCAEHDEEVRILNDHVENVYWQKMRQQDDPDTQWGFATEVADDVHPDDGILTHIGRRDDVVPPDGGPPIRDPHSVWADAYAHQANCKDRMRRRSEEAIAKARWRASKKQQQDVLFEMTT